MFKDTTFPLFALVVGSKIEFFSFVDAYVLINCGLFSVEIPGQVVEADGKDREITLEEFMALTHQMPVIHKW